MKRSLSLLALCMLFGVAGCPDEEKETRKSTPVAAEPAQPAAPAAR